AIRHRKNNTLRLLPGGAGRCPGARFVCRGYRAPPPNTQTKTNKKTKTGTFYFLKYRGPQKIINLWFLAFFC
ncbi:hypothetical protein ACVGWN_11070, partial [Enterobacter hormaechei]